MLLIILYLWLQISPANIVSSQSDALAEAHIDVKSMTTDELDSLSEVFSYRFLDHYYAGNNDSALYYAHLGLTMDEILGEPEYISSSLNNLATVFLRLQEPQKAEPMARRALSIERTLDRPANLSGRLGILGEVLTAQNQFDEAESLTKEALHIDSVIGNVRKMAIHHSQLSNIYLRQERFREADSHLTPAIALLEQVRDTNSLIISLRQQSQLDRRFGRLAQAERHLLRCVELCEVSGQKANLASAYLELSFVYREHEQYRQAYMALDHYRLVNDTLFHRNMEESLAEAEARYHTAEAERELEVRHHIIAQQRAAILISVLALLLILVLTLFIYLRMREKEKALQAKNMFLRLVSHDLKNPAIAQQKALHSLQNCPPHTLSDDEYREVMTDLCLSADTQVDLLHNLLAWARMETKTLTYTPSSLCLNAVVDETMAVVKMQAESKHIRLVVDNAEQVQIHADKLMVTTILRNLLVNAIKFSYEGGEVAVRVLDDGFEVIDHGVGFPKGYDPSGKHVSTTAGTSGEKGTGFGLDICRRLAETNGLTLSIDSKPGSQTVVSVRKKD